MPLFAALATASGKNTESARQLAKLACPLLTRLVLKHNNIAEVRRGGREGGGGMEREQGWSRKGEHKRARYVLVLMLQLISLNQNSVNRNFRKWVGCEALALIQDNGSLL